MDGMIIETKSWLRLGVMISEWIYGNLNEYKDILMDIRLYKWI